jgi:hypothetical protein
VAGHVDVPGFTALAEIGPTTIMTGNATQIVIDQVDLVDLVGARREQAAAIKGSLRKKTPRWPVSPSAPCHARSPMPRCRSGASCFLLPCWLPSTSSYGVAMQRNPFPHEDL